MRAIVIAGIVSLGILASASPARAQEASSAPPATAKVAGTWGVETELVWPFVPQVHVFTLKGTRTLWGEAGGLRGDAVAGVYIRPDVSHDVVETIDEYLATLGYRQYVWRGLHAEVLTHTGWAWGTKNKIDGKDYSDFVLLLESNVGYRVGFLEAGGIGAPGRVGFYLTPQFGMVTGLYTNIGPRESADFFVTGKLLAGVSF